MLVFYYQWIDGATHTICVSGGYPHRLSPIWQNCNTSVMIVPGTHDEIEEEWNVEAASRNDRRVRDRKADHMRMNMLTYSDDPWCKDHAPWAVDRPPMIQHTHVDGPALHFSDGQMHWLTLWERFLVALGLADAASIQRKRRPRLSQAIDQAHLERFCQVSSSVKTEQIKQMNDATSGGPRRQEPRRWVLPILTRCQVEVVTVSLGVAVALFLLIFLLAKVL
jgi:hypothetical protein